MSPKEIRENKRSLAATPECKEAFREKIKEINEEILNLRATLNEHNRFAEQIKDEEQYKFFVAIAFPIIQRQESVLLKERKKWERLLNPHTDAERKSFDLEALKQKIPIQDLIASSPKRSSDSRITFQCPFHTEKTASFTVFLKDNTFHCFGCQAHGSLIDFVMRTEQLDFFKACQHINGL